MARTISCDKSGLKKGAWTPEEDRKLIAYVTKYGCWNWRQLPRFAGLARCGKSCRLRWMNYLRPNIKRGNITQEEEEIIIRLRTQLGSRWSAIAAHFPGRTDNEIKNHWHNYLKKRFQQDAVTREEVRDSKSDDSESRKERDGLFLGTLPATDTGLLSPQSYPSEFSSITTDHTITPSNENLVLDDDFAFLDAFAEPVNGNFWTEPYLADIFYAPSETVPGYVDGAFQSPDTTQTLNACALSSQPSSSESLILENDFAFLDAHTLAQSTVENFCTEPFVAADMSLVPSELLTPLVTESEYYSPVYDADLWSLSNLYADHSFIDYPNYDM